jgi:predicted aconitase with swiveling domain
MLFSKPIDSLAAAGAVLADVWLEDGKSKMPVIDSLGDEFLDYVKDGMNIIIQEGGKVVVSDPF